MVLDFLRGEFIDVISWLDETRDTMVWRFERRGQAIKYGAKLTVREGQAAVFVHEGQIADVFGPGLYELETNNLPLLTTLQHWDHGFASPFQSEVYFVATTRFNDQKWGTRNPVMARDPEFGPVRLRAFGTYAMRVTDPALFLREVVGTDGEFTADEISAQIRNVILQEVGRALAGSGIPVLDMAANTRDLGTIVAREIAPKVAGYGLALPEFYIENVSLPEEVEKAMDRRTSMGVVGDLGRYMQFNAAEAMAASGSAAAGAMQAGLGAALGMAIGQQAAAGPWGAHPPGTAAHPPAPVPAAPVPAAAAVPPPLPAGRAWHVAEGGAAQGPYPEETLPALAAAGRLGPDSMVWSPGMEGWKPARDTGLARLFPPPPSPPPPPLPKG